MYAITGITGQVGGAAARTLLSNGESVRGVVRNRSKAAPWEAQGAEIAAADLLDAAALESAFAGTDGVFIMTPPFQASEDMFAENRATLSALIRAVRAGKPPKVVLLSSVGAHLPRGTGAILKVHDVEQEFFQLPIPVASIRAAWFMENFAGLVPLVRDTGTMPSALDPLDRAIPMVATSDVGRVAAETLLQSWTGRRIIELEGPRQYAPNDVAAAFGSVLGRAVKPVVLPRTQWIPTYMSLGFSPGSAAAVAEMLDGVNSGWIDFERKGAEHVIGRIPIEDVLRAVTHEPASA